MAFIIGEAAVRVTANARRLHEDLRDEVQKKSKGIAAEVGMEFDDRQIEQEFKRVKKKLEGEDFHVDVMTIAHTESAAKKLDDFRRKYSKWNSEYQLNIDVDDRSLRDAQDDINDFRVEQEANSINIDVELLLRSAAMSMEAFRKLHGRPLHVAVIPDFSKFAMPTVIPAMSMPTTSMSFPEPKALDWTPFLAKNLTAMNLLPEAISHLNQQLVQGIELIYGDYITAIQKVAAKFRDLKDSVKKNALGPVKDLSDVMWSVYIRGSQLVNGTKSGFKKAFDGIKSGSGSLKRSLMQTFSETYQAMPKWAKTATDKTIGFIKNSVKSIRNFASATVDYVKALPGRVAKFAREIPGKISSAFSAAKEGIAGFFSGIGKTIKGFASNVASTFGGIVGGIKNKLSKIGDSIVDGLENFFVDALLTMPASLANAVDFIMREVDFGFPKRVLQMFGGPVKNAFTKFGSWVGGWSSKLGERMVEGLKNSWRKDKALFKLIRDKMGDIGRVAISSIKALPKRISGYFSNMRKSIASRFSSFKGVMSRNFGFLAIPAKKAFGVMGRLASAGFKKIANSSKVLSYVNKSFTRMGRIASGINRVVIGAFSQMAGVLMKTLVPAIMAAVAGLVAMGGYAIIGGIMAVAGAIGAVAHGAALMLPALLGVAAVSFAALKIGLSGVKQGVSAAFSAETVGEFEEAIAKLPPQVQNIARSFRAFKGPMDEMKKNVQENMLSGLAPMITNAMNALFPRFKAGLEGIAQMWNGSFKHALRALSSEEAKRGTSAIMKGAVEMAAEMRPMLGNIIKATGSLAEQGAKHLKGLGTAFNGMSEKFFNYAESLRKIDPATGMSRFDTIIKAAKENAKALGDILGGAFGVLGNIMKAGATGGGGMLGGMATAMQELNKNTKEGTEGFKKMQQFVSGASDAASKLKDVLAPIGSILGSVLVGLVDLANGAMPGLTKMFEGIRDGLKPIENIAGKFGEDLGAALEAISPSLALLGDALAPLIGGLGDGLAKMFKEAQPFLENTMTVLGEITKAMEPLWGIVGEAMGKIMTAFNPIITSLGSMITAVMPLLGTAFDYIGKIATALIDLVAPLFEGRDGVFQKLFESIGPLIPVIGEGLLGAIAALKPVVDPLVKALQAVIQIVIDNMPMVVQAFQVGFKIIIDAINWVVPIIGTLLNWLRVLIEHLGPILTTALHVLVGVFQVVWPLINSIVKTAIKVVIVPLINFLGQTFHVLMDVFTFLVNGVFQPLWDVLKGLFQKGVDIIVWIIDNVLTPGLEGIKDTFGAVVDGISKIWNGLKKIFAEPIKFMIETVINGGIIGAWNKVNKFLGNKLGELKPLDVPKSLNMATGGVLPGYTPGRDVHSFVSPTGGRLNLSGGEAIMRPEWTRAVGGPAAVEAMNRTARAGGVAAVKRELGEGAQFYNGGVMAFAKGGVIEDKIRRTQEEARKHHGKPYQWGGVGNPSFDCSGLWSGIASHLNGGPFGGRLFTTHTFMGSPPPGWVAGLSGPVTVGVNAGHMAGTLGGINMESAGGGKGVQIGGSALGSDDGSFVKHFTLKDFVGEFISGGTGGGGGGLFSMMWNKAKDMIGGFLSKVKDKIAGKHPSEPGQFNHILPVVAEKTFESVTDWIKDKVMSLFPGGSSGGGPGGAAPPEGVEHWRPLVEQILKAKGLSLGYTNTTLRRMAQESGGNPGAINNWDSNAAKGTPSKGLMQVIDPTFQTHKDPGFDDIWDPESNIRASMNYAISRYGSLPAAYDRPGGYAHGGMAGFGRGLLHKTAIEPERVLSPAQTRAFNDFVYKFMPSLIGSYRANPAKSLNFGKDITKEVQRILAKDREERTKTMTKAVQNGFESKKMRNMFTDIVGDPWAYLDAEKRAKEQMQEDLDAAKQKELDALDKASQAEEKAIEEQRKSDDDAEAKAKEAEEKSNEDDDKDNGDDPEVAAAGDMQVAADDMQVAADDMKDAADTTDAAAAASADAADTTADAADVDAKTSEKDEKRKKEDEARKSEQDKKREAIEKKYEREAKRREGDEFWYGYKVFGENGENPNAHEATGEETIARAIVSGFGDVTGTSDITSAIMEKVDFGIELGSAVQTAIPAWMALSRGDARGYNHNVAVAQKVYREDMQKSWSEYLPQAIPGMIGSAISAGQVANMQPFIGTVNSGMTQAELMQTLNTYEQRRARQLGGTVRTR